MNAKLSPEDGARTAHRCSSLPAYAHLLDCIPINARERKSSQCEPVNIFIAFQTVLGFDSIVYILQFMSEFLSLYLPGEGLLQAGSF